MRQFFCIFIVFIFVCPVYAKEYKNSYVSFDIPKLWECKDFGTDTVCHNKSQEKNVHAFVTTTAKIAGESDTLDGYQSYLEQEKTWSNSKGEELTSKKVTPPKKIFIHKFPWVFGIHKNSEIKTYITQYVGTVCCEDTSSKLGILVSLNVNEEHYTKYSRDFLKIVNSLKVMDIEEAIAKVRAAQAMGEGMEGYLEGLFDEDLEDSSDGQGEDIFGLDNKKKLGLMGLAALGGLIAYRILKKRGRKKRRSRRRHRSRRRR